VAPPVEGLSQAQSSVVDRIAHTVTVAAITSTLRGSRTEVALGIAHGLKQESCVNLCNAFTVRQSELRTYVGSVDRRTMDEVCLALAIACDCG
jgi:mRNA-degrading endonuclease toxin of MazEF toxin-antitoxin module